MIEVDTTCHVPGCINGASRVTRIGDTVERFVCLFQASADCPVVQRAEALRRALAAGGPLPPGGMIRTNPDRGAR